MLDGEYVYRIECLFQYEDCVWCGEWGMPAGQESASLSAEDSKDAYEKLFILLDAALDSAGAEPANGQAFPVGEDFLANWMNG